MIMKCEHCKLDYKQAQMIEYKGKFFVVKVVRAFGKFCMKVD